MFFGARFAFAEGRNRPRGCARSWRPRDPGETRHGAPEMPAHRLAPLSNKGFFRLGRGYPGDLIGFSSVTSTVVSHSYLSESVAHVRFAVHSDVMSNSGVAARYYWCLRHNRVESEDNACAERYRLGPYSSAAEAEQALSRVAERNAAWDAEDARWSGEQP